MLTLSQVSKLPIRFEKVDSIDRLGMLPELEEFDLTVMDDRLTPGDFIKGPKMTRNDVTDGKMSTKIIIGADDPTLAMQAKRMGFQIVSVVVT